MLKGYSLPRTPKGTSSLAPHPPWHYVGTCLAVEYEADPGAVKSFLPGGLEFHSPQCAAYFVEWQYASDAGVEYLDPARSQYKETIILISAAWQGQPVAYCPSSGKEKGTDTLFNKKVNCCLSPILVTNFDELAIYIRK